MEKTLFEQMGGTYTQQGSYLLPNLALPAEEKRPIGVWGQRRLRYLKQHHRILYFELLTSGKLHSHLADVEEQALELFPRLVNEYAKREGVDEHLKVTDQMVWVQRMHNIQVRVLEIVNSDVIFVHL